MFSNSKILIADDSELNRAILSDMLCSSYEIICASDGEEAIEILEKSVRDISLLLLDSSMPQVDGFDVLKVMNDRHWIEEVPVLMVIAEKDGDLIDRAYKHGVTDFIIRPFDQTLVRRRVENTMLLHSKQERLVEIVSDQISKKDNQSRIAADIITKAFQSVSGESDMHMVRIHYLTEFLLRELMRTSDKYALTENDISLAATAAEFHDIGKTAIDSHILNKPGKLTEREFETVKSHPVIGSEMLDELRDENDDPLLTEAYSICRWHHERWDGNGYPDGLSGEEIPLSAQVVAIADVYDALTSDREDREAFSHGEAVEMILNGNCGAFDPVLLRCFESISKGLDKRLARRAAQARDIEEARKLKLVRDSLHAGGRFSPERSVQLIENEREKHRLYSALTKEIEFEYTVSPNQLKVSEYGAKRLGLDELVSDPMESDTIRSLISEVDYERLITSVNNATADNPTISMECIVNCKKGARWNSIVIQTLWSAEEPRQFTGVIGKSIDINDYQLRQEELEKRAAHDPLTGLFNHRSAKKRIVEYMENDPRAKYALAIFDLDYFKHANDNYGHSFGDETLKDFAHRLKNSIRAGDIAARVGGDEFLLFIQVKAELEPIIKRIHSSLMGQFKQFTISVSMGVAETEKVGMDYQTLFDAADQALYYAKNNGKGRYCFYDENIKNNSSLISPIESDGAVERR